MIQAMYLSRFPKPKWLLSNLTSLLTANETTFVVSFTESESDSASEFEDDDDEWMD